jgi:hypothetical protein
LARISVDGKQKYFGRFSEEQDAANALAEHDRDHVVVVTTAPSAVTILVNATATAQCPR